MRRTRGAATILALSVTDSRAFCFGGEVPIMVYDALRHGVTVIAGQGAAPRLATLEHFKGPGGIPASGIEAAAVPAALDACLTLLDRFGTMTFAQVIAPTQALLPRAGTASAVACRFRPDARNVGRVRGTGLPGKLGLGAGDRARGLRLVADAFYRGPIARRIDAWSRAKGGLIRYVDLATHTTRIEEPVAVNYRGQTVYKCGPWTQGPYLLEALQILKDIDLKAMGHNRPRGGPYHGRDTEAGHGRSRYLLRRSPLCRRAARGSSLTGIRRDRRGLIDPEHASLARRPGDPLGHKAVLDPAADPAQRHILPPPSPAHDTTTCLVADRFGNVVAATPSGWTGVVAGDTGVWLGSRLQSFNVWEDHPNVIVPGKRPRITLSPTLVLRDNRPVLAISVAGGDNQDQMTLQLLLNHFDFGLEPAESVVAPRFMTDHFIGSFRQTPPVLGQFRINPEIGSGTLDALKALGHTLTRQNWLVGRRAVRDRAGPRQRSRSARPATRAPAGTRWRTDRSTRRMSPDESLHTRQGLEPSLHAAQR